MPDMRAHLQVFTQAYKVDATNQQHPSMMSLPILYSTGQACECRNSNVGHAFIFAPSAAPKHWKEELHKHVQ
ncbi:hypothetical protein DUNSADRAFT_17632 [Dunaliella salina]|uniref:Encoded protein n=1 Tax=Dunaliella salina TaxID=3046 RepID=A0ABQ7GZV8_DUNSA|nr:hypothetical protein DUNSADRAFT_17632 [Dunaliella salina]|eukprot:KAF5840148.1 hypothetical protein DUNSADRAFT_17632 [Dunaliella salina]